jgi:hypothetical protein
VRTDNTEKEVTFSHLFSFFFIFAVNSHLKVRGYQRQAARGVDTGDTAGVNRNEAMGSEIRASSFSASTNPSTSKPATPLPISPYRYALKELSES